MLFILLLLVFASIHSQIIKQLNEISIKEEVPIGSIVTFLTDKIANLEQSLEYDLVTPLSSEFDLFSIDHIRYSLNTKKRLDYEQICSKKLAHSCLISVSIAVSNHDTIDVYLLPIEIENIDDNPLTFPVNRTVIEIEENDEHWSTTSYPLPVAMADTDEHSITYSLYFQNWTKPDGFFELNQHNLSLKPRKQFDREEQNLYLLRLIAHHPHEKDLSLDILVLIKDQNDNAPKCPSHLLVLSIDSISTFSINATDLDNEENGKLEYHFINPSSGFTINHDHGQITFDSKNWIRDNQSKLFINITDHGKPTRLSTECTINFRLTFLYDIQFQSNGVIHIEHLNSSIGQLRILDQQTRKACVNCAIRITTSHDDIVSLDARGLYLNWNSKVLIRILSNELISHENLPVTMNIDVYDRMNPSIISSRKYSLNFHFHKEKILKNSKTLFLRIDENLRFNQSISLSNQYHHCLRNQSRSWKLIDPTDTFEIDRNLHLTIRKFFNTKQRDYYQVFLKDSEDNQITQCSIELRIFIYNLYHSRSFYILTSSNLSSFVLPSLPPYVKYISSKSNEVSVDERNGSMTIRSPSLFARYSYDFQIQTIDSQTPSLTDAIPVRIFFGINRQPPRLVKNDTQQTVDVSSGGFLYQIEVTDPDLSIEGIIPPIIEYQIDPSEELEIDRYSGRIFMKNFNRSRYDFTVILTDFGQPNRLITRERMTLDIRSNEKANRREVSMLISRTFILISAGIFVILVLFTLILVVCNSCYQKSSRKKSLANLSPTTPDSRLIDNEYITTTTSLPRVLNREQRIYPTVFNDNSNKSLEQMYLPPPPLYSAERVSIRRDLSIKDINKYLERFEKIYNNSSDEHFREPVGSVV